MSFEPDLHPPHLTPLFITPPPIPTAWAAVRLRSKPLCVVSLVINAALFIVFMSYFSAAFSLNTTTRMPPALIISLIFTSFMALTEVATVVSLIYLIQHPLFSAPPRFVGPANSELVRSGGVPATSDPDIVVTQSDIITYFPPQSHQPVPLPYPQYNANAYPSCPLPPPSPPPPTSTLPPTSPTPTPKHPSTTSKANVVDTRVATSTSTPGRGSSSSVLPPTLPPPSVKERNQQLTSTPSAAVASSLR